MYHNRDGVNGTCSENKVIGDVTGGGNSEYGNPGGALRVEELNCKLAEGRKGNWAVVVIKCKYLGGGGHYVL